MAALNTIVEGVRGQGQHGHRRVGPARDGRREPAGQPLRRRHAAEPLHRGRGRLLPRPQGQGAEPGRRTALRQDRRHRGLPRDGARGDHHRRRGAEDPDRRPHRRHGLLQQEGRRGGRRRSDQVDLARRHVGRPEEGRTTPATPSSPSAATRFQVGYTFHPLLAAVAGPDIYNRFYDGTPDDDRLRRAGLCARRSRPSARSPARPTRAGSTAPGTTPPTP